MSATSMSLLVSSWTMIWYLFLTDLAFTVAILMLGLGSLSPKSTVLMCMRFDVFTPLGCFTCLFVVLPLFLFILNLHGCYLLYWDLELGICCHAACSLHVPLALCLSR